MSTKEDPSFVQAAELKPGLNKFPGHIYINGSVPVGKEILCEGDVTVGGDLTSGVRTAFGNVVVTSQYGEVSVHGKIGNCAEVNGQRGVDAQEVLSGASVTSERGNIEVRGNIGAASTLKAVRGQISCKSHDDGVRFPGKTYVDGEHMVRNARIYGATQPPSQVAGASSWEQRSQPKPAAAARQR